MKNSPVLLAFFFVLITITRVATFVVYGLKIGVLGYSFAIGLTAGVFLSAYFIRWKETQLPAMVSLVLFLCGDLMFNVLEVARTLGTQNIVPSGASFVGLTDQDLTFVFQWSAVVWAVFPTLAAALLGWLQAGAGRVANLNRPTLLARLNAALSKVVTGWGVAFAIKLESNAKSASGYSPNPPQLDGQISARRWHSLTAEEIAKVPRMSRPEMMAYFGISDGAAGAWKRRVESGERPWKELQQ